MAKSEFDIPGRLPLKVIFGTFQPIRMPMQDANLVLAQLKKLVQVETC